MNRWSAAVLALALAACDAEIIDLGRNATDASVDAPVDAAACRCRIAPCRASSECAIIGGACGADFYCVGDFGPCSTDSDCRATVTDSVCTRGPTSVERCGL
jgi:hypothetical protein